MSYRLEATVEYQDGTKEVFDCISDLSMSYVDGENGAAISDTIHIELEDEDIFISPHAYKKISVKELPALWVEDEEDE